ncbi:MAG: hypothetical protein ABIN96_03955 [Rubrivivax sp.]
MPNALPVTGTPLLDRDPARLMHASLARLLDQVRGARAVLPHLTALERALGKQGLTVVDTCPHPALARICAQLASLPLPDDDIPLQALQTRLLQALGGPAAGLAAATAASGSRAATNSAANATAPAAHTPDFRPSMPFDDSRMLSVDEASMTDFDAAVQAQA